MQRPKLRKKKVKGHEYWFSAAGAVYFGEVGEVAYVDACRHFAVHIKERQATVQTEILSVAKLIHLAMIERVYGHLRKDHLVNAHRRLEEARRTRRQKAANQDPSAST